MQITVTKEGFIRGLGWTLWSLFWLVLGFIVLFLFTKQSDSGAAYIIIGFAVVAGTTFPLVLVPVGIMIYGVRKDPGAPLWMVLLKWGTIAGVVYLGLLAVILLFII